MEFRYFRTLLALAFLWLLPPLASASFQLAKLRCEYLQNPLGLDELNPRLSWQIDSDQRATHQSAYRILVASSPALLHQDRGDLWDSGKMSSDQSIQVEYAGKPLESGESCYWKVQTWDDRGTASPWSDTASWTMGLLKPEDWKGKWIGEATAPDDLKQTSPPPAPMLRKTFAINKPVRHATAYVCSLGYYELHLNGNKVGDHVLDPPVTQFNKRALYVTYDVTSQLKTGQNAVGIELGSSWYNSTPKDAWNFYRAAWRARPQMRMQLDLEFDDGSHQQIVSDDSWKMSTGALLYDQTRVGEVYDARLEKNGPVSSEWTRAGSNVKLKVTIPANTTATVYVPANDPEAISESGIQAAKADGVKYLRNDGKTALFEVGSGSYEFSTTVK